MHYSGDGWFERTLSSIGAKSGRKIDEAIDRIPVGIRIIFILVTAFILVNVVLWMLSPWLIAVEGVWFACGILASAWSRGATLERCKRAGISYDLSDEDVTPFIILGGMASLIFIGWMELHPLVPEDGRTRFTLCFRLPEDFPTWSGSSFS